MKGRLFHARALPFLSLSLSLAAVPLGPASAIAQSTTTWSVAALDQILAAVPPGQNLARVGDMAAIYGAGPTLSAVVTNTADSGGTLSGARNIGAWSILADQILGTGGPMQLTDPGVAPLPAGFYRVTAEP